ncbi:MAG: hypothetical protein ACRC2T_08545, partial [Thermoguttaceae bacterium]
QQVLLSVHLYGDERKGTVLNSTEAVHQIDLQEMSDWFSGTLLESAFQFHATNLFFHPLPSGNYTIGRMVPQQRGFFSFLKGQNSFLVQYLIVSPELLGVFANNPILLYQKITEQFPVLFGTHPPKKLTPVSLTVTDQVSSDSILDLTQVLSVLENTGIDNVSTLVQSTLDSVCTFFTGGPAALKVISTVLNLLPISWRTELTFSTELNFSLSRPLKLVGISGGADMFNLNSSDRRISFCDLNKDSLPVISNKWVKFIRKVILSGNFDFLRQKFCQEWEQKQNITGLDDSQFVVPEELDFLAKEWSDELTNSATQYVFCSDVNVETRTSQIVCPINVTAGDTLGGVTAGNVLDFNSTGSNKVGNNTSNNANNNAGDTADAGDLNQENSQVEYPFIQFQPLANYSVEYSSENEPAEMSHLATMMQQKMVRVPSSVSSSGCRTARFPHISSEIKNLDSCTARFLFGDYTALSQFKTNWSEACSIVSPVQLLELTEDYVMLVRDFLENCHTTNGCRIPERDVNAMELLDVLLKNV